MILLIPSYLVPGTPACGEKSPSNPGLSLVAFYRLSFSSCIFTYQQALAKTPQSMLEGLIRSFNNHGTLSNLIERLCCIASDIFLLHSLSAIVFSPFCAQNHSKPPLLHVLSQVPLQVCFDLNILPYHLSCLTSASSFCPSLGQFTISTTS